MKFRCCCNEGIRGQSADAVYNGSRAVIALDFFEQQIEVAIAGEQHDDVDGLRCLQDINCNADVPIALRGAVAALDEGFEFYVEADMSQRILELALARITPVSRVSGR